MLSIVLQFDVIEGKDGEFVRAWTKCTEVIYENFGSLGSRLHRAEDGTFIAYAQWPDEVTYDAVSEWPPELSIYQDQMRALLKTGKPLVLHRLHVEVDLLKNTKFDDAF